jgi:hypothetical protein
MPKSQQINLPPLPQGAPGKPKGNRYKPQFGIIVLAEDEPAQAALFEALKAQGHRCKVVNT